MFTRGGRKRRTSVKPSNVIESYIVSDRVRVSAIEKRRDKASGAGNGAEAARRVILARIRSAKVATRAPLICISQLDARGRADVPRRAGHASDASKPRRGCTHAARGLRKRS